MLSIVFQQVINKMPIGNKQLVDSKLYGRKD